MHRRIERGLTGNPVAMCYPDEVAEFRTECMKAGLPDLDAAVEVLPALIGRWAPWRAACLFAAVVNAAGVPPERYLGAAMAVRVVADGLASAAHDA
jgi:hypothetical protein